LDGLESMALDFVLFQITILMKQQEHMEMATEQATLSMKIFARQEKQIVFLLDSHVVQEGK